MKGRRGDVSYPPVVKTILMFFQGTQLSESVLLPTKIATDEFSVTLFGVQQEWEQLAYIICNSKDLCNRNLYSYGSS